MPTAFESAHSRHGGQTLAEVLGRGPLPLEIGLRYATEIASALREMHQDGRAHGAVNPEHVIIRSSEVVLLNPEKLVLSDPPEDLSSFGLVLYAMLAGRPPAGEEMRLVPPKPMAMKGPSAVRAAAMRLAERCLTADRERAPDFQKVLTEVRLLHVMAKHFSPEAAGLQLAPVVPDFPVSQPLEVFAGKATPVINPPAAPEAPAPAEEDEAQPESLVPGAESPATKRARGSHSRPILKDVACPKCLGYHVRLSRPRTRFERILNLLGIGVYRCHRCFFRYMPILGRKIVRKSSQS